MSELKTKVNNSSVKDFLNSITDETRRKDGLALLPLFEKATGEKAKMWGTSMVGFGMYHYKSERSSQEGDWPLVAYSPRKQNLTLYVIIQQYGGLDELLKKLGKNKTSKGCLYINKLADVDLKRLLEGRARLGVGAELLDEYLGRALGVQQAPLETAGKDGSFVVLNRGQPARVDLV